MVFPKSAFSASMFFALVFLWASSATSQTTPIQPVQSEFQIVGGFSVGNIHLFGYSDNRQIYPFGVEYDRRVRGSLAGLRLDYVAELLPVVLLNEPAQYKVDGTALTTARQIQYGAGFTPIGARILWRKPGQLQPYLIGKGGILYFRNRVLSTEGTHLQFSAEFGAGVEKAISNRIGFRVAYNDFHFSNGDIGRHNPGIDLMEMQAGLTLRLSRR
jgi:hypothetical protein